VSARGVAALAAACLFSSSAAEPAPAPGRRPLEEEREAFGIRVRAGRGDRQLGPQLLAAGLFAPEGEARLGDVRRPAREADRGRDRIEDARGAAGTAATAAGKALEKCHQAELAEASAPPESKAPFTKLKTAACDDKKAVEKARDDAASAATKLAGETLKKNAVVPSSGDLLGPLLEDLIGTVTARIMAVIDTNARNLLSQGFKFVRACSTPSPRV